MPRGHKSHGFENPKKSLLDESNPVSYLPDGRNLQADYYRLENREKQLALIASLTQNEKNYIMGAANATTENITSAVQAIHEKDLIELKCLVYLNKLADSSPELFALKQWCGCESREQIARYIAEKEMKKLVVSQVTRIAGGDTLNTVYNAAIVKSPDAFKGLYAATPGNLFT